MSAASRLDPLAVVEEKVAQGERLSAADGVALFESHDLLRVGRLADRVRRQRVGDDVYFVVNRHINYTNVCRNRCRFCAFSREEGEAGAYTLTVDEVLAKAREAVEQGATEIHIVGGENPSLPYSSIRAMVAGIREMAPEVHIKAFTASEIACFAEAEQATVEEILRDLKAAGLDSMPGGGAEILRAEVRAQVCPAKISGETLAGDSQARPRTRPEDQRDHALRPRGDVRRPGGPPAPAARSAGRDQRVPGLHPAGFPAQEQRSLAASPHHRRRRSQDAGGRPPAARQLRCTSRPTGS